MAHPFFDAINFPWYRPESTPLLNVLSQAINEVQRIDLLYHSSKEGLPPLALHGNAPDVIWKEALEKLTKYKALQVLFEHLLSDPSLKNESVQSVIRSVINAESAAVVDSRPPVSEEPASKEINILTEPANSHLTIQNRLNDDIYLITGMPGSDFKKGDSLVVFDEIAGTEVAIALLKVTLVNPGSLSAQAILVHSARDIVAGLRVDNKLEHLSTSELVPAADYAIGYLLREGRIRLRPNSNMQRGSVLIALEPEIVDAVVVDHMDTSTVMHITNIGQGGAVAAVELQKGVWPQLGALVKQASSELPEQGVKVVSQPQRWPFIQNAFYRVVAIALVVAAGYGFYRLINSLDLVTPDTPDTATRTPSTAANPDTTVPPEATTAPAAAPETPTVEATTVALQATQTAEVIVEETTEGSQATQTTEAAVEETAVSLQLAQTAVAPSGISILKPFYGNWPITQAFGANPQFYSQVFYDGVPLKGHNGIDFGVPQGTVILAADDGTVLRIDYEDQGYGHFIVLEHAWGQSLYTQLERIDVQVDQTIRRGEAIALSGNSGLGAGPHLHFGIRINPYSRVDGWGGYSDPQLYMELPTPTPIPATS